MSGRNEKPWRMRTDGRNAAGILLTDSILADSRVGLPPLLRSAPVAVAALLLGAFFMFDPLLVGLAAAALIVMLSTINVRAQMALLVATLPLYRMGMGSEVGSGFGPFDLYTVWFALLFLWKLGPVELLRVRLPGVVVLASVMLCGFIPSAIHADSSVAYWRGMLQVIIGLLLMAGVYTRLMQNGKESFVVQLLRLFTVSSALFAIWGIIMSARSGSLMRIAGVVGRYYNFLFGDPNFYSGFLLMALCIAVGLALAAGTPRQRFIQWAASGALLLANLLTVSRAGYLSSFICGIIFAIYLWRHTNLKRLVATVALLAAAVGTGFLLLTDLGSNLLGLLTVSDRMTSAVSGQDASMNQRANILKVGWRMAWHTPVFGVGLGNFEHTFDRYREAELSTTNHQACHNTYLKLFAETGAIGFLTAILYYGALMRALWKSYRAQTATHRRHMMFGLSIGIFSYFLMSATLDQLYEAHFWIMSGFAVACTHIFAQPADRT
jgi:O-antigen ligase